MDFKPADGSRQDSVEVVQIARAQQNRRSALTSDRDDSAIVALIQNCEFFVLVQHLVSLAA